MKHTVTEMKTEKGKSVLVHHSLSYQTLPELKRKFEDLAHKLGYNVSVQVAERGYKKTEQKPIGYYYNTADWESGSIVCYEQK
jgi:hypothetical protein